MDLKNRVEAFSKLGILIGQIVENQYNDNDENGLLFLLNKNSNEWFIPSNIIFMLKNISCNLEINNLNSWTSNYPKLNKMGNPKKIGLITAGNIPLVGFHDVLCVLISGHKLIVKHSSKDEKLMSWLLGQLIDIEPKFKEFIHTEKEQLRNFDAIIATGSDNTAKYFEYYFGKYPNIIRKNRNSIAILTGNETEEDLHLLADDMLIYFGLGCRNVSKLYLPEYYDIQKIFKSVVKYDNLINHNKFCNNYLYNKSIYLLNQVEFFENGFLILKEDIAINSPISVVHYEFYNNIEVVKKRIDLENDKIQCIVAKEGLINGSIEFGQSQKPGLDDYADNVDTMKFLLALN
jgi:hypothetical protein